MYALLQFVMIGALEPMNIVKGWSMPLGTDPSDYGAWYTLALAVGAGWLAKTLIIDAVISPAGTGVVYVATTARLSYALGEEREMPAALTKTNRRGVPWISILVASLIGCVALGPFKSWSSLVTVITGATAMMYAFAPVALAALHKVDGQRPRPYRVPMPKFVLPAAFCSANLIIYWGGFEVLWKLDLALLPIWGWGPALGPGHLNPERAAQATALIGPRVAIPIHWGTLALPLKLGRAADPQRPAREFAAFAAREAPGVEVRVLAPGEHTTVD